MLNHLKLGCKSNRSAVLKNYLMNFCAFPDLTQGEAIINEENLPVDGRKAALVVQTEINGEM